MAILIFVGCYLQNRSQIRNDLGWQIYDVYCNSKMYMLQNVIFTFSFSLYLLNSGQEIGYIWQSKNECVYFLNFFKCNMSLFFVWYYCKYKAYARWQIVIKKHVSFAFLYFSFSLRMGVRLLHMIFIVANLRCNVKMNTMLIIKHVSGDDMYVFSKTFIFKCVFYFCRFLVFFASASSFRLC